MCNTAMVARTPVPSSIETIQDSILFPAFGFSVEVMVGCSPINNVLLSITLICKNPAQRTYVKIVRRVLNHLPGRISQLSHSWPRAKFNMESRMGMLFRAIIQMYSVPQRNSDSKKISRKERYTSLNQRNLSQSVPAFNPRMETVTPHWTSSQDLCVVFLGW